MKKTASFLLACAMVLTAFAGCSSGTTSSTAGASSAAGEESAAQSEAASDEAPEKKPPFSSGTPCPAPTAT